MFARSVVPMVGIFALQAGLVCNTGFAATGVASLSVSATVEVGCQVSPDGSAASVESETKRSSSLVSVSCSLPVPYLVTMNRSSQAELAAPDTTALGLSNLSGVRRVSDGGLLRAHDWPLGSAGESEYDPIRQVFLGLPPGLAEAAQGTAENPDPGIITVAIVY